MFPDKHLAKFDGGPLDGLRVNVSELANAVTIMAGARRWIYVRSTIDSFAHRSEFAREPETWTRNAFDLELLHVEPASRELRAAA